MACRPDQKSMLLGELLKGVADSGSASRLLINAISMDSRDIQQGSLFCAVLGATHHGLDYLKEVIEAGAFAIVAEVGGRWDRVSIADAAGRYGLPIILVEDLGRKVGQLASRFFGYPSQSLRVVGITGTNGKSSVAHYVAAALSQKISAGVLGTLGNGLFGDLSPSSHTTLNPVTLQAEIANQLSQGAKAIAMEVSSHALDQSRVAGVTFHTVVFTNLSQDHLDYHKTMEAYAAAKTRLFRRAGVMHAVVNVDDAHGATMVAQYGRDQSFVAVSLKNQKSEFADRFIAASSVKSSSTGLKISFDSSWGAGSISSELMGEFNAENLLLSLGVLLSWEMPLETAIEVLQAVKSVPGRMQVIRSDKAPLVIVDFAHTPDALDQVLSVLRQQCDGQLICVFGCGGNRDAMKRPLMGAAVQKHADVIWLTDDNPRDESGDEIINQIKQGMQLTESVHIERDREKAIAKAIAAASIDDVVLIAGKGHEAYQEIKGQKIAISDQAVAERVLTEVAA